MKIITNNETDHIKSTINPTIWVASKTKEKRIISNKRITICPLLLVGCGFVLQSGHTKDHHKNGLNYLPAWHKDTRAVVAVQLF